MSMRLALLDRVWSSVWTGVAVVGVVALLALRLDRFPFWDEGVFLTQAGGIDGSSAPPAFLGPSREVGSVWYQQMLQALVTNYPNLRALHLLLVLLVLAAAATRIGRATEVPAALLVIVLGSYWITLTYLGDFLRFALLTFILIGGIGAYLLLVGRPDPRPREAATVALWFSAGLLLGPFEAGTVLIAVVIHSIAKGFLWSQRRLVPVAASVLLVAFVLPFMLDTRRRFGSLGERVRFLRGRDSPLNNSDLDWTTIGEYVSLAVRGPVSNAAYAPSQAVMDILLPVSVMLLALGALAAVEGLVRLLLRRPVADVYLLLSLAFLLLMAFLGGFYEALSDRYWILPGSLLLIMGLARLVCLARSLLRQRVADPIVRARYATLLGIVASLVYLLPNAMLAERIDLHRTGTKESASVLRLARAAVGEAPCSAVARWNTPSVQWATGCDTQQARSFDAAVEWALGLDPDDGYALVYWDIGAVSPQGVDALMRAGFRPLLHLTDAGQRHQVYLRSGP